MLRNISLLLYGCALFTQFEWNFVQADASNELQKLIDDYQHFRFDESPELATFSGDHQYDNRVSEWTEEAFIRRKASAEDFLERADQFNLNELNEEEQMSNTILKYTLSDFIDGFTYRKHSIYNMLSPLEEPTESWLGLFQSMLYNNEQDYENAFARLHAFDTYVNQRIVLLTAAIAEGTTLHEASLTGVITKMNAQIVADPVDSDFYKILFDRPKPDNISPNKWASLQDDAKPIIENTFVPGWVTFKTFIENVYSLNTRVQEGVLGIPDGLAYYDACLKWHLSTDMPADEVHQVGLSEVDRISGLMEQEIDNLGYGDMALQDFIQNVIQADPENFYDDPDELLAGYQDIYDFAHSKMPTLLINVPTTECRVEKYDNPDGPVGMYYGPTATKPYGTFVANVFHPENVPKSDMYALTLHESEPGHHTQISYNLESDLPSFRREIAYENYGAVPFNWQFYTAYTEGWGLYAESLGIDIGAYEDKYALFGRYSYEMWRATRLVVDTGIHAKGWTKIQAIDYIGNHTNFARPEIENEVNRYISWPGQACAYKLGEIQLTELRTKAEDTLGGNFDIRHFNEEILKIGPVPMSILESEINAWIDKISSEAWRPRANVYVVACLFIRALTFYN